MYGVFLAIGDRRERARARAVVERERGFRLVGEAGDGATAFAMIRDIQPDVVIAELRMPFVDGAALCRGLRRSFPWMESLIVGARNDALFAGALNEAELERSLSTPITALALSEALHRAAERADAERRAIPGRVRRAAAEQDPSEHPGRGGLPPWPEDGRPRRVVWIPAPDAERRRDAFGALLRIEQMRVAEDGMFTFRLEDGAGMVMVRGEGTELEALAYGAANIARFSLGDVMGFRPQIYVSSEETDAVGMRRALEALRARGASPEPGWLILGMDDRPRPLRGMRFPVSPLGEALLTARPGEAEGLLARAESLGMGGAGEAARAASNVAFEAGATDFIWMPVWNPEGQRRQLLEALALRDALRPGLSNHLLARIRSLTALSFRSPGFTLSTAAQMVGLSDCRFSRVFLQETGVPFAHYLEHLRVHAAMLMLRNTRVRLSAAAEAAGFSDSELFERSFQRRTGMEARVYRKMLLGK